MRTGSLPEGRRGAALALGLLAVAVILVWAGGAAPLLGWYRDRAVRLGEQRMLAAHMAAVAATLPAMQAAARHARAAPPREALLSGSSDAVAAAALQGTVEGITRDAGANLSSVTILPGEPAGAWRRIGLRLDVHAPFAVIVQLLRTMLRAAPPMVVDDLSMAGPALGTPGEPRTIDAAFTVYAFRRGAAVSSAAGPATPPDARPAFTE
ncbi:MAG TPA: type II secretion system protein GspM [Acetobacteraceae bacterium]|nr:type II secretion system protein GspM [Acetobacteraceae bacterium]